MSWNIQQNYDAVFLRLGHGREIGPFVASGFDCLGAYYGGRVSFRFVWLDGTVENLVRFYPVIPSRKTVNFDGITYYRLDLLLS